MNLTFFVLSDNTAGDYTFLNKFARQLLEYKDYKITFIVTEENLAYPDDTFNKITWNPNILLEKKQIEDFYSGMKKLNSDVLFVSGLPQPHGACNHYHLLDQFRNDGIRILNFMYDNSPWNPGSFTFLKSTYGNYPLEFVYTCPIATPSPEPLKDVHFWNSYPEKVSVTKEYKKQVKEKFSVPEKDKLIFMSVSNWTKIFPMTEGYYLVFFERLLEVLAEVKYRTHFFVINKGNFLKGLQGSYGNCTFQPLELLNKNDYEDLLLSSDLVVSDNARQSSMVKANSAFIPSLLIQNSQVFEKETETASAQKMKNDNYYSFSRSLGNIESIVKNENYYALLNTADLFNGELFGKFEGLLGGTDKFALMEKQKRYFLGLHSLPKAFEILVS